MADIVDMRTLAVLGGPDFKGDMTAALSARAQVKAEFRKPPRHHCHCHIGAA